MAGTAIAKQPELVPAETPAPANADLMTTIAHLAANPAVNVDALERLIALKERVDARDAETAFNVAFLAMQLELPVITEKGQIKDRNGLVQSRYALNEDIQETVRPILKKHGFSLTFKTEWPGPRVVKVVGILTHTKGHSRTSEFQSSADDSGNKNAIQALGSAVSYGHRYTTVDLLNLTSRGHDDDGHGTDLATVADAPEGYQDWFDDMRACAEEGSDVLKAAWDKSPLGYRKHLTKTNPRGWQQIKKIAEQVNS